MIVWPNAWRWVLAITLILFFAIFAILSMIIPSTDESHDTSGNKTTRYQCRVASPHQWASCWEIR